MEEINLPKIWQEWEIEDYLGSGTYGSVYKARFTGNASDSVYEYSAVKVINIPSDDAERDAVAHEITDPRARENYYSEIVSGFEGEIKTLEKLKDNAHVVHLIDHFIDHKEGSCSWTIYIMMELLTPFDDYTLLNVVDEECAMDLALDLCDALKECAEKGIIHRDIKSENVLVDENGSFKLGDFGIARSMSATSGSLTARKGTFTYMAPEVYHGEKNYDIRVDQYSLGILLYKIFNKNREPFIDADVEMPSYLLKEKALEKRMNGEVLPDPADASESMKHFIKKMCAYRPEDRYGSIDEVIAVLERVRAGEDVTVTDLVEISEEDRKIKIRKNRRVRVLLIIAAVVIALGVTAFIQTRKTRVEELVEDSAAINTAIKEEGNEVAQEIDSSGMPSGNQYGSEYSSLISSAEEFIRENSEVSDDYDRSKISIIYLDDKWIAAELISFKTEIADTSNFELVDSSMELFYLKVTDNGFERQGEQNLLEDENISREELYGNYYPEGLKDAMENGRNYTVYKAAFWLGEDAYYDDAVKLETAAVWQEEDGSLMTYMICRNGSDRDWDERGYYLALYDGDDEAFRKDVLKAYGDISGWDDLPAASASGGLMAFDSSILEYSPENFDELWEYTSGFNNYQEF